MSILIKGLDMPITCLHCWLNSMKQCRATGGDTTWSIATKNRRGDCPLIELPDHGDLVDKDELSMLVGESFDYFLARLGLKCPKAIIPAERRD